MLLGWCPCPFRYSSTAKSAVVAAGGYGPAEPLQNAAISEFLLADERVRQLTPQRTTLVTRLARLEAQRDGIGTFSAPSSLGAAAEGREVAEVIAAEKKTFASQATIVKNQLDLFRPQRPRLQKRPRHSPHRWRQRRS
jgi:polysaccharide biosynthesis/export protein